MIDISSIKEEISLDPLGDYCKSLERVETERRARPDQILLARLDGRAFHSITKGLEKPSTRFMDAMCGAALSVATQFNPNIIYIQSDEISMLWKLPREESQFPFGGKFHKINSILPCIVSDRFYQLFYSDNTQPTICFDCRSWAVDNMAEALDVFVWRQQDAIRNAINLIAHDKFSNKKLDGVRQSDRIKMLQEIGVNMADFSEEFRNGVFLVPFKTEMPLLSSELERIPEKHRPTLGAKVERTLWTQRVVNLSDLKNPAEFLLTGKVGDKK